MIPYLFLLFFVVFVATLGRKYGSVGVRRLSLVFVAAFLIFFAGFRDRTVGTDTGNYVAWLLRVTSIEEALIFPIEIGYSFLVLLSSSLSDSYAVLLTLTACLVVGCYAVTIVRLVKVYEFSLFVFITLGVYTFFFNGARQGIAAALCFLALPWLLNRRAIPYFFFVFAATLFHKTAIIAAPLYFIARSHIGLREIFSVMFGVVTLSVFLSSLTEFAAFFIDERFASYGQSGVGGGHVQLAFLSVQGILLLLFKNQIEENKVWYCRLLNIYFIGLIPAIASVVSSANPSGILRLATYFSHTSILLWPMVFVSFKRVTDRRIFLLGFSSFALLYFVLTTTSFSGLSPYQLNMKPFL
ncbi:EpsG family protein [Billgrantia montanilacus]|uniref:EpsG family protein n=1 Tax=Billgrantia montanilacus TaxID=2282305 RepID=A0A368U4J1_9GAMM|nr:EpsG family protein [Halomonas montanilacus]RCV91012.1 EpsG family protein [Halomonas montanilacus]